MKTALRPGGLAQDNKTELARGAGSMSPSPSRWTRGGTAGANRSIHPGVQRLFNRWASSVSVASLPEESHEKLNFPVFGQVT